MLLTSIALVLLLLLILSLFLSTRAEKHPGKRRTVLLPGVEALEDRVVPALSLNAIKARIADEFPAVADPATSDVVRVSLLRTWVFQEADLGRGPSRLDLRQKIDYYHRSLPELVRLFDMDAGGVQSAGSAYFLMKLYEAYGYRSGRLDVGFLAHGSHAVTLVQVPLGDGHSSILIEDAATDRTAADADGNPMSVKRVAGLARLARADEVYWQEGENSGRDFLLSPRGRDTALAGGTWAFDPAADSPDAEEIRPGVWKMHASASGDRLENTWWERRPALYIAKFRPDMPLVFASTFAFPVRVRGAAGRMFAHSLPGGSLRMPELTLRDLKARIAAEFPAVADPATPDVVRVGLLRTWAFEQADLGDSSLLLDTRPEIDYYHRDAVGLVRLFDKDAGTVFCGGTAYFLMRLYEAYGYIAGRVSVGFMPSGNHTVTLVQVKLANGNTDTLIQDAYTDLTPVDAKGNPLGAARVARMARLGRGDEVYWEGGDASPRDLLVSAHGRDIYLRGASWSFDPATDSHDVERIRAGVYKLRGGPHGDRLIWKWWNYEVGSAIKRHRPGMPLVLASTFAFPLWVEGTAGEIFANSLPPGNLRDWRE